MSALAKITFSKKTIKKIKAARAKKLKTTLTVTPVSPAGTGTPKTIKLK